MVLRNSSGTTLDKENAISNQMLKLEDMVGLSIYPNFWVRVKAGGCRGSQNV